MTFISKTAGVASLISCVHDIHKTALIESNKNAAKANANSVICNSLKYQKADNLSYKDAQRKNWLNHGNFFAPITEACARIGGYIKGAAKTSIRYIPNFICASIAILANQNHKTTANIAAIGLGIIEGFDFLKNALSAWQRNDYLK